MQTHIKTSVEIELGAPFVASGLEFCWNIQLRSADAEVEINQ